MHKSLIQAVLFCTFFATTLFAEVIFCQDEQASLSINVQPDKKAFSFIYESKEMSLEGNLLDHTNEYIKFLEVEEDVLGDDLTYYDLRAGFLHEIFINENSEGAMKPTPSFEINNRAINQVWFVKWFNLMLKKVDENYTFYRIEGDDFGFDTDHPIKEGTPCTVII